jgi:hypothetical protein
MSQFAFIIGYSIFCFALSAVVMKFLRTWWVYFIVAPLVPPMLLIAIDVLWRGFLDTWASIAFVVSWLIALGCSVAYYIAKRIADSRRDPGQSTGSEPSSS